MERGRWRGGVKRSTSNNPKIMVQAYRTVQRRLDPQAPRERVGGPRARACDLAGHVVDDRRGVGADLLSHVVATHERVHAVARDNLGMVESLGDAREGAGWHEVEKDARKSNACGSYRTADSAR